MIVAIKKRKKNNTIIKLFLILFLVFGIAFLLYLKQGKNIDIFETSTEIENTQIQNAQKEQEEQKERELKELELKEQKEREKKEREEQRRIRLENERKEQEKQNIQRIILIEAEQVISLIGQKYIEDVKIVKNKIVYICKPNTNIEAITIRYGANALVKKSYNEIVVVVDIEYILKGRLR